MAKKSSVLLYNDTKLRILQLYHHTLVNIKLRIIRKLELFVTFTVDDAFNENLSKPLGNKSC